MEEKYYPASINIEKAGENRLFAYNENDNSNHIIPQVWGTLLSQITGSLTIEEHIENIKSSALGTKFSRTLLYEITKEWISQGLLRNENLITSRNKKNNNNIKDISLGCITYNRPNMVDRWLQIRTSTDDYNSNKIDILISEDSCDKKIIENIELIVQKYRSNYSGKIKFVSRAHRENYSNLLHTISNKKMPKEIIDFAINIDTPNYCTTTIGSNQNSLTLGSAGSALLTNDDDIECKAYSLSGNKEKDSIIFCDNYVSPVSFYPNMEQLEQNIKEIEKFNLFETSKDFLNSDLNKYVTAQDALSAISPKTAMFLEKELISTIAVIGGYAGARWYQNPYRSIVEPEQSLEEYFYNFEDYSAIKNNGINFIASDKIIFNNGAFFMGGIYCIDNTNMLPPVFPLGIFNDTIFGVLLNRCIGPVFSVILPTALYHNPKIKKEITKNEFNDLSVGIGNYSYFLVREFTESFVSKDCKTRLKETGYRFEELAKLNSADFEEYLKQIQLGYLSQMMHNIEAMKEFYDAGPSWWHEDMSKYYMLLKKEVENKDSIVPKELRVLDNKEKAKSLFKEYLKKYGITLQLWPEIWELSKQLNSEGKGLFGNHNH